MSKDKASCGCRRGVSLIYVTILLVAMFGIISFAVDLGRVQLTKTELRYAADSAARFGALSLKNILNGQSAAAQNAVIAAKDNKADGSPVLLDPNQDVQTGVWNAVNKTFTVTSDGNVADAIRVTARRTAARGNAVPLVFAKLIGRATCDVSATAIAELTPGQQETLTVPATSNPFLAGMPSGSVASLNNPHNSPDYAGTSSNPRQSPKKSGLTVSPGSSMTFDGINGNANNDINDPARYSADGNTGWITNNTNGAENGISDLRAPINGLVGVFLNDSQPNQSSAPSTLDFSTSAQRDFASLSPGLKQMFFIGDGRTSSGEVQQFKVPSGATRLYIATWDSYEWNNNVGSFSITIHRPGRVTLVR